MASGERKSADDFANSSSTQKGVASTSVNSPPSNRIRRAGRRAPQQGVPQNWDVPGLRAIMGYAVDKEGRPPPGGARMGSIKRPAELWMVGDVGTPKDEDLDLTKFPYGGYYRTEITTFPPTRLGMWDQKPPKQPAVRHKLKANISFVDGHVEAWDYARLSGNYRDIFAVTNR